MTIEEISSKINKGKEENCLYISPTHIQGGAKIIYDFKSLDLYERIEENTRKFIEEKLVNLIAKAKYDKKEVHSVLKFHLIFRGNFDDIPENNESFEDFILNNSNRIIAVYKYAVGTETRNFFIGFSQSETYNKYDYIYLKFDELLKAFKENNIDFSIIKKTDNSVPTLYIDNTETKINISYDPNKQVTKEDLNSILLSKKLDDFYFAILERRKEILSNEEYKKIMDSKPIYIGANEENIDELFNSLKNDSRYKEYGESIKKIVYSFAQIRHLGVLTMINDKIYDISNIEFVDIKKEKIINFEKVTNYYDESNARVRLFTVEEEPQLSKPEVLIDLDDETMAWDYEKKHVNQDEDEDLTKHFLEEANKNVKTLKKTDK